MKNTMTGNRVLFKIAGEVVGGGTQDVSFSDDFGLQDVDGLGNPETQELVTGKLSHSITISRYFISNKMLNRVGLVPNTDEVLTAGELEIEVQDLVSGETLELYTGCKVASHSRSYGKHTISGENATFRAKHKVK